MRFRRAFSLVELLVVLGITAILVAFLLTAVHQTKGRTRQTQCTSNLKQITAALRMYADDSNDLAPSTPDPSDPFQALTGFKPLIEKYLLAGKSSLKTHLFDCPADIFHFADFSATPKLVSRGLNQESSSGFSSYGFNGGNLTGLPNARGIAGQKLSQIKEPSRVAFVAENSAYIPWSWHQPNRPLSGTTALFNDAPNLLGFVDGHVAHVKIYWNGRPDSFALQQNPPPHYPYRWSEE